MADVDRGGVDRNEHWAGVVGASAIEVNRRPMTQLQPVQRANILELPSFRALVLVPSTTPSRQTAGAPGPASNIVH